MVNLDDVPMWAIDRGIGHIVAHTRGGWVATACNSFATLPQTEAQPKRVCRECRARLRFATRLKPSAR